MKNPTTFREQIAVQSWLRPALTPVPANVDYTRFKGILEDIEQILRTSGLERQAVEMVLEDFRGDAGARQRRARFALESLRVEVLRHLLGMPSFRELSKTICAGDLLSDFCGLRRIDGVRGAAKSTLERRSKLFSEEQLRRLHQTLTEVCGNSDLCAMIGLEEAVPMETCLVDSTCLEANIHFPVDWVLLRDVSLSLLQAIALIRREGLRRRMPESPEQLRRQMNALCIEMTHARRRPDASRKRKAVLREMKKLLRRIGGHARRHGEKLGRNWERTKWSERQARRLCERIEEKLAQIDPVIDQAHERIIGGRAVPTKEKILSVHESDVHVIVRGKAGKEVEFGNTLLLSENREGYLTDYRLYRERAPSEAKQLWESLQRQNRFDLDAIGEVCTDRGFASKETARRLKELSIFDATCPRDPHRLAASLQNERFLRLQQRRGSTEARIAIVANGFLGRRLRAKGYPNRARAVAFAVLSHNLWFLARRLAQQREKEPGREAA